MSDQESANGNPLLDELDSLKGLLDSDAPSPTGEPAGEVDIPVLDEVVDAAALPPSRQEIEKLVDQLLVRELARLRKELRERLIAEVTARLGARKG